MKLYLVRHGDALSGGQDPRRPLSPEGRKQVLKVGEMLLLMKVKVDRIECSTKTRAIETAEGIASRLGALDRVIPREGLKPNDSFAPVLEDFRGLREDRMLVGHLPYMANLASYLLVGSSSRLNLHFTPATVLCLSGEVDHHWSLFWMINPEMS